MERTYPANLVLRERRNFLFKIPEEVDAGTAMEACVDGTVLLGEVVWCRPYREHFEVLFAVRHGVNGRQAWYGLIRSDNPVD